MSRTYSCIVLSRAKQAKQEKKGGNFWYKVVHTHIPYVMKALENLKLYEYLYRW